MKQLFLFILGVSAGAAIHAQTSLEFIQVKTVTSTETIPSGKVWKVNAFFPSEALRDGAGPRLTHLGINGTPGIVGHSAWQYASYALGADHFQPLIYPFGFLQGQ